MEDIFKKDYVAVGHDHLHCSFLLCSSLHSPMSITYAIRRCPVVVVVASAVMWVGIVTGNPRVVWIQYRLVIYLYYFITIYV
jgi:hypothetical protein